MPIGSVTDTQSGGVLLRRIEDESSSNCGTLELN